MGKRGKLCYNAGVGEQEGLVKIPEALERLSVGRTTFQRLMSEGKIRTVRVGTRGIRVPLSEIDRFIAEAMRKEGEGEGE